MKKFKDAIIFIISFLVILLIEFVLYNNLDKLMPTYENKLYAFENEMSKNKQEFLFEMYEQAQIQNNYKEINQEELNKVFENEILYNILVKGIYNGFEREDLQKLAVYELFSSKLGNTIYGDLNIIGGLYSEWLVLYSEDMTKVCYVNMYEINRNSYKDKLYGAGPLIELQGETETGFNYIQKDKEELERTVRESISRVFKNYDFHADVIMYKENYYVLKDNEKDMTIYYSDYNDILLGFYTGFENSYD